MLYNLLSIASFSSVKPNAITESRKSSALNYKIILNILCCTYDLVPYDLALTDLTLYLQLSSKRLTRPSTEFLIAFNSTFNFSEMSIYTCITIAYIV